VATTLHEQHEHLQYDAMDTLYDFHVYMEVHEEVPMEVQLT
jgi:hypothetical protein